MYGGYMSNVIQKFDGILIIHRKIMRYILIEDETIKKVNIKINHLQNNIEMRANKARILMLEKTIKNGDWNEFYIERLRDYYKKGA